MRKDHGFCVYFPRKWELAVLEKQRRQNGKNEKEKKKPREKQSIKKKVKYFFSSHGQNNVILTH